MISLTADPKGIKWLYGVALLFAAVASFSVASEFYWMLLFPIAVLVIAVGLYRLDWLTLFVTFVTPLSINLAKTDLGIGVSLPSEPLIAGIALLVVAKMLYEGGFDRKILYHPVTLAIIFHLVWMFVTSFTSSLPLVSIKATLARFCFVMVFFFFLTQIFTNRNKIASFAWCYIIPLIIVIIYTTVNHAAAGFTEKAAHTSMVPFYNDHTAYAAAIAMYIPLIFGFISDHEAKKAHRIWAFIVLLIFISAIVLSYTRASWISLVAALGCYLIFLFRVRTWIVVGSIITIVVLYLSFQTQITLALEKNDKQSSTDYESHLESMSNISTDASNVERINRWNSAFRMFNEKPWFGWGPGTYMFQYAPFQKWSERTIISTNFGTGGNAHSEYIGPLAEQGVLGPIAFILIGILVIYRSSRIVIHSKDKRTRMLAKGLIIGLITYWVHGMLNNFLDTEKASVPYWGFIAGIVALDLYHQKNSGSQEIEPEING